MRFSTVATWSHLNRVRQEFWTKLLFKMNGQSQTIASGHPFHVHAHNIEGGISVACTNVIDNTSENVVIKLPASDIDDKRFQCLETCAEQGGSAEWVDVQPAVEISSDIATLTFDLQVPTLESAFITIT